MNNTAISVQHVLIKGYPHLVGTDAHLLLHQENFFSLHVGDKVNRIGDGRNNSTHRTLLIQPYMTYAGSYSWPEDRQKYYCFLLPPGGVSGWDEHNPEVPVYSCFVNIADKLVGLQNFKNHTCFCYIPEFTLVKQP